MAEEVQQIYEDVDRAHPREEASADSHALGDVAALDALETDVSVEHAHRAVAVEAEGPQAR